MRHILRHIRTAIARSHLAGGILLLGALVVLSSCAPGQSRVEQTPTAPASLAPAPTVFAVPLTPVASLLGPAPQNCPISPTLQSMTFPDGASSIGRSSVWESGLPPGDTLHLNLYGYTPWPIQKIIWYVEPNYTERFTLQAGDRRTGARLWFDHPASGGAAPDAMATTSYVVTPDGVSVWSNGGVLLYLPQASCYYLEATWPEGSWRITFAAGR